MKKAFRLDGDICPNCANKIQASISKLPGVNSASVNAMTLKFTLNAEDGAFDGVLKSSIKVFADIEPDVEVLV